MPDAEPFVTPPSAQEAGVVLLRPGEEVEKLRRRRERPGEIGRSLLLLLGSICAGAGAALWFTHGSIVAEALVSFGAILIGLGLVEHVLLRRDRMHWVDQAHLWNDGIELILHNGEIRAASWTDPGLAFDIFVRPRRKPTDDERLLIWRKDPKVPPCDLSEVGLDKLKHAVTAHELGFTEFRRGRRTREARAYEVRAGRTSSRVSLSTPESSQPG